MNLTILSDFVSLASGLIATVYGFGERYCGHPSNPSPCSLGAVTASGEIFDPSLPTLAVPMPENTRLRSPVYIKIRTAESPCVRVKVNDKKHPRYIGTQGFDLSPAAVALLGVKPTRYWSDKVYLCEDADAIFKMVTFDSVIRNGDDWRYR